MTISRARKDELVAEYKQQLAESSGVVMANYTALSVHQMEDLRRRAREQDGRICVVKNTLMSLVLTEQGMTPPEELFTGPTVVAFCHQDVAPLAKLFREFAGEIEEDYFVVKGGLLGKSFLSTEETLAVADMPSREVLMAQVLGTINAPASQTVGVISSSIRQIMVVANAVRQVINVMQAYVDKMENEGATA